jgi:hypothetical protein
MNKNIGSIDRGLRAGVGLLIVVLYLAGELSGTYAIAFGIVAAALLLTSAVGVCPVYAILKITSTKKD